MDSGLVLLSEIASHDYRSCAGKCIQVCDHCKCFKVDCACFEECECPCDDEDDECECVCVCECICVTHTECRHFCKHSGICIMSLCQNYRVCKGKLPVHHKEANNGICIWCKVYFGHVSFTDVFDECSICMDVKNVLKTPCGHEFCIDCYGKWRCNNNTCPICRADI